MNLYLVTFVGSLDRERHIVAASLTVVEEYCTKKGLKIMNIKVIQFDISVI